MATNYAATVSGTPSVADLNTIDLDTTGVITASVTGTAAALAVLTGTGNAYTLTVSAGSVAATDLTALDALTTVAVVASAVTTITGTGAEIAAAVGAAGITKPANFAATVSGSPSIANLNTIDAATTGVITATVTDTVTNLTSLTGTNNAYTLSVSDTATIAELTTIDALTTGTVTASSITDLASNMATGYVNAATGTVIANGTAGADTIDFSTGYTKGMTINGLADADTITGGSGADIIVGGLGADVIDLTAGGSDAVRVAVGDSLAAPGGYDSVTGYDNNNDTIDLATTTISVDAAAVDGTDAGGFGSHDIANGLIRLDADSAFDTEVIINAGNITNVLTYISTNITTSDSVLLQFDADGNGSYGAGDGVFVFQDGRDGCSDG